MTLTIFFPTSVLSAPWFQPVTFFGNICYSEKAEGLTLEYMRASDCFYFLLDTLIYRMSCPLIRIYADEGCADHFLVNPEFSITSFLQLSIFLFWVCFYLHWILYRNTSSLVFSQLKDNDKCAKSCKCGMIAFSLVKNW